MAMPFHWGRPNARFENKPNNSAERLSENTPEFALFIGKNIADPG